MNGVDGAPQIEKIRLRHVRTHQLCVTNCEGSEILPSLLSNKLACHSFMDADRGHGTPRLEIKNSL